MSVVRFIYRRMAAGAALLALYGLWVVCLRLPGGMPAATRAASCAWALGLFAGAGMVLALGAAGLAYGLARMLPLRSRPPVAASVEALVLVPLFAWLVLNEVVYSTTSQVLGYQTALLVWANLDAVLQNAWAMGAKYLLGVGAAATIAAMLLWWRSWRSFRSLWSAGCLNAVDPGQPESLPTAPALGTSSASFSPCPPLPQPPSALRPLARTRGSDRRLVGSLTGGLAVLAGLLAWQFHSRPSVALTTLCRSAPSLRALNLTRVLLGTGLEGPPDLCHGAPIISDLEYESRMGAPGPPAANVVVIVLESVSAKALHCYGHAQADITPNLDALAAGGVLFEHCVNTASFSSYGLVSSLTSLYVLRAEINDHFADTSFPHFSLSQALKLAGYQLALFSSGNEAFDNINRFSPPDIFDSYSSLDTANVPKPDCMRLDDHYAIERFEQWIATRHSPRPFYCRFYLQSTHFNYQVPEPWASHYLPVPPLYSNGNGIIHIPPDVLPLLKNQYDNAMRFSDHWVGRIRAALERAQAFDNTILVVIADHGEAFMEHGLARHGVHLWEEMIHIPFILYAGPAVRARLDHPLPARVAGTVSGVDVAPTVAALVGIQPHPSWQGVDVLAPGYSSQDRPVFSVLQLTNWKEAVILNGFKYIYDLGEVQAQLFDLRSDPGEKIDLADKRPELAAVMKNLLGTWHARQLHYYAPPNRPFTHYLGRFDPDPALLARFHVALDTQTPTHSADR